MWPAMASKVQDFMWPHKSCLNPIPPIRTRGSAFAVPSVNCSELLRNRYSSAAARIAIGAAVGIVARVAAQIAAQADTAKTVH